MHVQVLTYFAMSFFPNEDIELHFGDIHDPVVKLFEIITKFWCYFWRRGVKISISGWP